MLSSFELQCKLMILQEIQNIDWVDLLEVCTVLDIQDFHAYAVYGTLHDSNWLNVIRWLIKTEGYHKHSQKLKSSNVIPTSVKSEIEENWWPGEEYEKKLEAWEASSETKQNNNCCIAWHFFCSTWIGFPFWTSFSCTWYYYSILDKRYKIFEIKQQH